MGRQTASSGKEQMLRRIKRCETARMWMVVLASLLLVAGYVSNVKPLFVGCVVPLLIAGILTYAIKHWEREVADDDGLL